jgi:hypothetical protein
VVVMLAARYLVFVARLRPQTPDPTAVKIIGFGAGDAGAQLTLHGRAMLDSDIRLEMCVKSSRA